MEIKKKQLDQIYFGAFAVLVVLVILGNYTNTGFSLVVIDNADPNSMYPTYQQGDMFLLLSEKADDFKMGDVIVYSNPNDSTNVIHRIVDIIIDGDDYYFRVKGDNPISNYRLDYDLGTLIPYDNVLGKVVSRIPILGHISLAIQQNVAIKIIVFALAILLAISIIFWPEDEEDSDEKVTIGFGLFIKWLKNKLNLKKQYNEFSKTNNHKIKMLGIILITMLTLTPLVLPNFLSTQDTLDETGISHIEVNYIKEYSDSVGGNNYDIVFMQLLINFVDKSGGLSSLTEFEVYVYTDIDDPSTEISHTVWNSMRDIRGTVTVGGSILIDNEDVPTADTLLYIVIEYTIKKLFSTVYGEFMDTYNYLVDS